MTKSTEKNEEKPRKKELTEDQKKERKDKRSETMKERQKALTEEDRENIKNRRIERNNVLDKINSEKDKKVNSKLSKYHEISSDYREIIKKNLKKNTKNKVKSIIGVKKLGRGTTSLAFIHPMNFLVKVGKELIINKKHSGKKSFSLDLIVHTLKNK